MEAREEFSARAFEYFKAGHHCSESTSLALSEYLGIKSDLIPRIATGFQGGMGYSNMVCGAVAGAVMALGIKFGRDNLEGHRWSTTDKVSLLISDFRKHMDGATTCNEITRQDFTDRAAYDEFRKNRRLSDCGRAVQYAVRRAIEIMEVEWPHPDEGPTAERLGDPTQRTRSS